VDNPFACEFFIAMAHKADVIGVQELTGVGGVRTVAGHAIAGGNRIMYNALVEHGSIVAHETDILLPQKIFPLASVRVMAASAL
jgi:hypothetical protein